jgi:predicted porin
VPPDPQIQTKEILNMTRKLLALAVAGALVAPIAAQADDSTVTLTGVVNGSIDFIKRGKNGDNKPNIGTNATRFQIDGKEPLGNGWAAIFSLAVDQAFAGPNSISEKGIAGGGGAQGSLENRNSHIGLAMPFGTVRIGQNEHQYEIQQIIQDPFPASENEWNALKAMTNYAQNFGQGLTGDGGGFTRRDPQSIWYTSPNWGGFILDLAYITGNGCKDKVNGTELCPSNGVVNANPKGYQIAAQYGLGSLTFYGALAQYNDYELGGSGIDKDRAIRFGVGWAAGPLKLDGAIEKLKGSGGTGVDGAKNTNYYVAAAYNIGNGQIRAQYAKLGDDKDGASRPKGGNNWGLGYGHALSKRTELYAYTGKRKVNNTNVAKGISLGVRHSF